MNASRRRRRRRPSHELRCEAERWPLLTYEQERELLARVAQNDEEAAWQLVMHNLRFAVYMATRYTRLRERGFEFDDLVQEASLGLVEAVVAYKTTETVKFVTYAAYHITKNIVVAAKWAHRPIRVPDDVYNALRRPDLGHSDFMQIRMQFAREALRIFWMDPDELDTLPERSDPVDLDAMLDRYDRGLRLFDALEKIRPRSAAALVMRYGLGGHPQMDLREIAREFGVTQERARQITLRGYDELLTVLRNMPGGSRFFAN